MSRGEIEEVFEIQGMLEERGAYYATQRRTPEDVDKVKETLQHLDDLIARQPLDLEAFGNANAAFHERLFEASGRSYYCRILRTLRNTAERYARVGASMLEDLHSSQAEHHAILAAFEKGSAKEVARLCRVHRENTRDRLLSLLEI
jgi:DNA-binding GntR family transcriptional regulator